MNKLDKNLQAELDSWDVTKPEIRKIKLEREWVRYPYLIQKLGLLNLLYLHEKTALDIGPGPMGGLLQLLPCKEKWTLDPLNNEYLNRFPEFYNGEMHYITEQAEKIDFGDSSFDLILSTNALDHTPQPSLVLRNIKKWIKPSGYVALSFCRNLSKIHPHEAHINALDEQWLLSIMEQDFETIFCKVDKYGWVKDPWTGKVGQPAIYYLGRMTTKEIK